jgi:hypothetical protein
LFLRHTRIFWTALAAAATMLPKPALAEFQIQEATIEKELKSEVDHESGNG